MDKVYIANGVTLVGIKAPNVELHMVGKDCHVWHSTINKVYIHGKNSSFCHNVVLGSWEE